MHAISLAPQIITYMTVNLLHAMEQSDNIKKTVAKFRSTFIRIVYSVENGILLMQLTYLHAG